MSTSKTISIILIVIVGLMNVTSLTLIKKGLLTITDIDDILYEKIKILLYNHHFVFGALLYGLATVIGLFVLSINDLSYTYPLLGVISLIFVTVSSIFFLHETISIGRLVGILLMCGGWIFIATS